MIKKIIVSIILFWVCASSGYTQGNQIEQLNNANELIKKGEIKEAIRIWENLIIYENEEQVSDSVRMICLMKLTQSYLLDLNDVDTTLIYLNLLEDHCFQSKNNRCYVFKFSLESLYHEFNDDYISSIQAGKKGIEYLNQGGSEDLWFTAYTNYGYNFYQIGEIEKAREQFILAAKAKDQSDYDKLEYSINMSSTFESQYDSVLFYSQSVLSLCDTLQDIWLCPYVINNVAFSQASLGDFEEAEHIIEQEFVKNKFLNEAETQIRAELNHTIGYVKSSLGKLNPAERYLLNSLELAREIGSNKTIRSCLKDLSALYEKKKQYNKSLKLLKEEASISELIHTEEIQKELANYENAKILKEKEFQIDSLEEENFNISSTLKKLSWVLLSLLFLFIIAGIVFVYRSQQNKIKFHSLNNEINLAKLQSLQVSMNPHFLFNTFSTLQLFILESNSEKALDYLGRLSNLLRRILYNSESVVVKINEEIDMLQSYFYLEAARFDHDIELNVIASEKVTNKNPLIPAMILQPHLENAIHHGLSNSNRTGIINFEFHELDNFLKCSITDNGVGREVSAVKTGKRQHLSTASKNTSSRIEILKKLGYSQSDLHIIDLKDNSGNALGTRVEIILPFMN